MAFSKPYPPTPIDYLQYDALVDALETRGGPGFKGYLKDRTQIINSRGNLFDFEPGGVQDAIDDLYDDHGGAMWLPKGKVTETDQWIMDEVYPIYINGAGMCWADENYGTSIVFNVPNGINCIELFKTGSAGHFGGLYDMTLYQTGGNQDMVKVESWSDWHMERIFINQAKRHGLHVQSEGDVWNLWVKDNLIENTVGSGIRLDGGAGAGVILKSYFLNNYFFSNAIDIEAGNLDGDAGQVRLCQFYNNQHFNTDGIGFKMYKKCESFIIVGHIFYKTVGDAIDIDDDGVGNRCFRINIGPLLIDGDATTPNGINLAGFTDHVLLDNFQIFDWTGAAIVEGGNITNFAKGDGFEA